MRIRPLLIGLGLLGFAYAITPDQEVQEIPHFELPAEMSSQVQADLERAWRVFSENPTASEYAFCITQYGVVATSDSIPVLFIQEIQRAQPESSSPVSITYSCGPFPAIHAHPPTDCEIARDGTWTCVPAGKESMAELCEPSPTDVHTTAEDWHRIHGVQCGPRRVRFFSPDIFRD